MRSLLRSFELLRQFVYLLESGARSTYLLRLRVIVAFDFTPYVKSPIVLLCPNTNSKPLVISEFKFSSGNSVPKEVGKVRFRRAISPLRSRLNISNSAVNNPLRIESSNPILAILDSNQVRSGLAIPLEDNPIVVTFSVNKYLPLG